MAHAYTESGSRRSIESHYRVHGNSEQTHVFVLPLDDDDYAVVAVDTDPIDFEPVAAECVAYEPTKEGARKRAKRWMQTHTKGVFGEGESSGGLMDKIMALFEKADDYGKQQIPDGDNDG